MARPYSTDALGRPRDLIGQPLTDRVSVLTAIGLTEEVVFPMANKAEKTGVYELNGARFHINAGDILPEGATVVDDVDTKTGAPENRAETTAKTAETRKKAE